MLTTVFIAGPKTTVTIKYWELLSTNVSVKEVYITSFQGWLLEYNGGGGALIGDGVLIEKSVCQPGHLLEMRIQGANFYGTQFCFVFAFAADSNKQI